MTTKPERRSVFEVHGWSGVVAFGAGCAVAGCGVATPDGEGTTRDEDQQTATVESAASTRYDWLQYNGNPQHTGNNTLETSLGASDVAQLTRKFQVTLPAVADGAPVYLASVSTPSGVRDVLFVTTRDGRIIALDGQTGATLWSKQSG